MFGFKKKKEVINSDFLDNDSVININGEDESSSQNKFFDMFDLTIDDNKKYPNISFSIISTLITILMLIFFSFYYLLFQIYSIKMFLSVLVLATINIVYYLLIKDDIGSLSEKLGFAHFCIALLIILFSGVNHFFYVTITVPLMAKITRPEVLFVPFMFAGLLNLFLFVFLFQYFNTKQHREILMNIRKISAKGTISAFKKKKAQAKETKSNVPDIKICVDTETKNPVIIPVKDRFLHTLILGPTGSGKTSQVILPMIYQDIQRPGIGITVIEPKSDLAEKVAMMAKVLGKDYIYFNPTMSDCPFFNPLFGKEEEVIENIVTTFRMLDPDSTQYFQNMAETLIRNGLKIIKRFFGDGATLLHLNKLAYKQNEAKKWVAEIERGKDYEGNMLALSEDKMDEIKDIAQWFKGEYFNEKSKMYEHCSGIRSQLLKIVSNPNLRRVLNPNINKGEYNQIDFVKHLEEGGIITIATAQGELRELGQYLGYFVIFQFQSAVFKRPGDENTRRPHFLYIDEFQKYSNPGFADMLTQGRSYVVSSNLATQNRELIGMEARNGKALIQLVSTNARNLIIFPGGDPNDAEYYSKKFGEVTKIKEDQIEIIKPFDPLKSKWEEKQDTTVTISKKTSSRFSPTDIMERPFGYITYQIVRHNTLQPPGVGKIEYIPEKLNTHLNALIEELREKELLKKERKMQYEMLSNEEKEKTDYITFINNISQINNDSQTSEQAVDSSFTKKDYNQWIDKDVFEEVDYEKDVPFGVVLDEEEENNNTQYITDDFTDIIPGEFGSVSINENEIPDIDYEIPEGIEDYYTFDNENDNADIGNVDYIKPDISKDIIDTNQPENEIEENNHEKDENFSEKKLEITQENNNNTPNNDDMEIVDVGIDEDIGGY